MSKWILVSSCLLSRYSFLCSFIYPLTHSCSQQVYVNSQSTVLAAGDRVWARQACARTELQFRVADSRPGSKYPRQMKVGSVAPREIKAMGAKEWEWD